MTKLKRLSLDQELHKKLDAGDKTHDIRTAFPMYEGIREGDVIGFGTREWITRVIVEGITKVDVSQAKNFRDAFEMVLRAIDPDIEVAASKVIPGINIEKGLEMAKQMFDYDDCKKFGMLVFETKKV
ncbi:hypothetical protein JW758_00850 [Candidatus Peregrinibacteria bacterium]|nr:hypothetical protein [Candidatus Peregrinibacteria bacterium]